MRNKSEIHGQLTINRRYLAEARKDRSAVLIRFYEAKIKALQGDLRAVKVYGGEVVAMRTPWKRLEGPRFFEEL